MHSSTAPDKAQKKKITNALQLSTVKAKPTNKKMEKLKNR